MAHHGYRGIAQLVEQRSPKPRAEGSSPSAPAKTKRHLRVSFYFVVKAEELEPRYSKVLALVTVISPVDCLRIELIINSLPKKAPNFRCFFPLFTLYYGDFTYFSHIDKITAHGLFRTPSFHFHTFFVHFVPHNPPNPFGTSSKKHQSQVKFVSDYFFFFI